MHLRHITAGLALSLLGIAPGAMAFNTRGAYGDPQGQYQQHASKKFRGMDRNGDGIITRDEWRGNDKSFRKHDRNGDGVISAADERGNGKYKAKKNHRQERDHDEDDD